MSEEPKLESLSSDSHSTSSNSSTDSTSTSSEVATQLPPEITLGLFSHLTQRTLGRITSVCKSWEQLLRTESLWRVVSFELNGFGINEKSFLSELHAISSKSRNTLTSLTLEDPKTNPIFRFSRPINRMLEFKGDYAFDDTEGKLKEKSIVYWSKLLSPLQPSIQTFKILKISKIWEYDDFTWQLIRACREKGLRLSELTFLEHPNLSASRNLQVSQSLFSILKRKNQLMSPENQSLTFLRTFENALVYSFVPSLSNSSPANTQYFERLKVLIIHKKLEEYTKRFEGSIMDLLPYLTGLKVLYIEELQVSEKDSKVGATELTSLQELYISSIKCSTDGTAKMLLLQKFTDHIRAPQLARVELHSSLVRLVEMKPQLREFAIIDPDSKLHEVIEVLDGLEGLMHLEIQLEDGEGSVDLESLFDKLGDTKVCPQLLSIALPEDFEPKEIEWEAWDELLKSRKGLQLKFVEQTKVEISFSAI